jgi:hypothetical protein
MARLSYPDSTRWQALAGRVTRVLEPRLSDQVRGNRATVDRRGWSLRSLRPSLGQARLRAARLASRASLLVRTDVASFYPSVTPGVLAASLRRVGTESADARLAADLVDGWGSDGYAGLPIGPPGSAVLANAVLRPVDGALRDLPFLRWVDDYLIGCRTEREARWALDLLDETLAGLGLRRSRAKTRVEADRPGIRWPGGSSLAGN